MAEMDFFSFHTIQMQKVFNFKIAPRRNITMHVQSHELHHGCSNEMGPTKHRKGLQIDVLNTANYDKGLDNPNPTSDGHDKPFRTKAITIIDNFKKALGDTNY